MFERSWIVACPANAGPAVYQIPDLRFPEDRSEMELSAWGSGLEGSNAYIFEDSVQLQDAQDRVANLTRIDALLIVPRGGVASVRVPSNMQERVTVFFDTVFANIQLVQVRVRECRTH